MQKGANLLFCLDKISHRRFYNPPVFQKILGGWGQFKFLKRFDVDFYAKIWVFHWDQIKICSK